MTQFGQNLAAIRARVIHQINNKIGEVRSSFITVMPGQEMLYLAKEMEARAFLADPSPQSRGQETKYRFMHGEAGITAESPQAVAEIVLAKAEEWRTIASALDTLRLGSIQQISEAQGRGQIDSLHAAFLSDLDAFLASLG